MGKTICLLCFEATQMCFNLQEKESSKVKEEVLHSKANVLIVGPRGKGMICEVQFLLQFMKDGKSQGHALYEVSRREQFVEDVCLSLTRYYCPLSFSLQKTQTKNRTQVIR